MPSGAITARDADAASGSMALETAFVAAAATNPPNALVRITMIQSADAGAAKTGTTLVPSTTALTDGTPPVAPTYSMSESAKTTPVRAPTMNAVM